MGKKIRKWLCIALAVVLMASALPLIAGAIAGGSLQGASSSGQGPLKVEIKSNKDKYTLLGKMEFTATITNISNETVENISAQALLGASLRPLNGSQFTAAKTSLAPGESFSFKYYADLNGLKSLDNLLLPLFWVSSLFHGGKADIGNGNGGANPIEASKAVGLISLFAGQYDASTIVKVWCGNTRPYPPALNDKTGVWHEVIDKIDDIIDSAEYTGNYSHDSALAQETYERLITFLDEKKQQGYVKGYTIGESGISYGLSTGLVGMIMWEDIYNPSRMEEIQTQNTTINQNAQEQLSFSATLAPASINNKLSIAVLQPRYSKDGLFGLQFKTSVFDNSANNIATSNSNYQFSTSLKDDDVTIEQMKYLENNRIVVFDSHGVMIEWANNTFGLQLGIEVTEVMSRTPQYSADCYPVNGQTPRLVIGYKGGVMLTTEFFRYYYRNKTFDNTLFYSGTCHGADTSEFFTTLRSRGVKTLLAYKNPVHPNYGNKIFDTIFGNSGLLSTNNSTVENAVSIAKSMHGEKDNLWTTETKDWLNETFTSRPHSEPAELVLFGDALWSLDKDYSPDTSTTTTLSGVVKDFDTDEPLIGATITISNADNSKVFTATTDWGGRFSLVLPVSDYSMEVTCQGYGTDIMHNIFEGVPQGSPLDITIYMRRLSGEFAAITGTVLEQGTNAPLPGVFVQATKAGSSAIEDSSTTSASGGFILIVESDTAYNVKFTKAGYVELTLANVDVGKTLALGNVLMVPLVPSGFAGGTGTELAPYQISTPQQLDNVRNHLDKNFILINDIDLASWGNWEPIGDAYGLLFSGVFDGNEYIIKNMTIATTTNGTYAGLFGNIDGATIKNTGMINSMVDLNSTSYVGGIVGYSANSRISNCYNIGKVASTSTSYQSVGGIAGNTGLTTIENCYYNGEVSGSVAGGIVGQGSLAINNCYNAGEISGETTGGITGIGGTINGCYNTGTVKSTGQAGGIAGQASEISNCYNTGTVSTTVLGSNNARAGGIVGYLANGATNNCYNIGTVSATGGNYRYEGGIAGYVSTSSALNNCYYTNNLPAVGISYNYTNVAILTDTQMKQQASFVGFDFTSVWAINPAINNSYPYLRGMQP